jgi:hypothetical protein
MTAIYRYSYLLRFQFLLCYSLNHPIWLYWTVATLLFFMKQYYVVVVVIIIIIIIFVLTSERFSDFSQEYGSHCPSTSYSAFYQKRLNIHVFIIIIIIIIIIINIIIYIMVICHTSTGSSV